MANDAQARVLMMFEIAGMAPLLTSHGSLLVRSAVADPEAFLTSDQGRGVRVIVTPGPIPLEEWMWRLPGLGLIACMGVGYDGIDLGRARSQGVAVTAGRGINREDVADLAIGLMIAAVRQIVPGDRLVRSGKWDRLPAFALARSITRMRCGILGLGAIGTTIARRLTGFGVSIAWWGPNRKLDAKWPRAESLEALARDSDVLIVAAPSTSASRGSIDGAVLRALGPDGYLVNVSRGDLVDEAALQAALLEGRIAGAALDVYGKEPNDGKRWRDFENVVLTPHIGGRAARGWDEAQQMCAANVDAFLRGEPLVTPVPLN